MLMQRRLPFSIKSFFLHLLIFLLFVFAYSICYTPGLRPLKVGIYDNPPLVFLDENGIPKGFDIAMLNYVAAQEGWLTEYVFEEWSLLLEKIQVDEIDLLMGMTFTAEHNKLLDYGDAEFFSTWGAVSAL